MRIAVVGSGAVGGYYGAKLGRAGHEVVFVARGAHRAAIEAGGLRVQSPLGDFAVRAVAVDDTSRLEPADLVLLAVKTYDLDAALPLVGSLVGQGTTVLTLQNGVDSPEQVAAVVGRGAVIGGAAYIATALVSPGVIVQTGTHRRIAFGEVFDPPGNLSRRVAALHEAFAAADIESEPHADARVPLWEKFTYLAPLAGFTAAARRPSGDVWYEPSARVPFLEGVREVERVARAEGVPVASDLLARITAYMDALPREMRSSMLIDLDAGRRIEVEALQGSVVRRGLARGVPTPVMATLYAVLRPHAHGRTVPD